MATSSTPLRRNSTRSAAIEANAAPPSRSMIRDGAVMCQGASAVCRGRPCALSSPQRAAITSAVRVRSITEGTRTTSRPRAMAARRRMGAITSMMRKAAASASVMGKPRKSLFHAGSGSRSCEPKRATATPTTRGTSSASAIQTMRSERSGTDLASGMKAMRKSATLGRSAPSRSSGHAAATAARKARSPPSRRWH